MTAMPRYLRLEPLPGGIVARSHETAVITCGDDLLRVGLASTITEAPSNPNSTASFESVEGGTIVLFTGPTGHQYTVVIPEGSTTAAAHLWAIVEDVGRSKLAAQVARVEGLGFGDPDEIVTVEIGPLQADMTRGDIRLGSGLFRGAIDFFRKVSVSAADKAKIRNRERKPRK